MNDQWIDFAIRIQSIAQAGLQYGKDKMEMI
ncbi:MAG: NUDIX hydrolase N-terminal domain-containing protein [Fusicatenibacter sp.]|nr:NUDIX hydrolase N-terminal domain-containing protein [Lachnospiraceae bacterium]MDY2938343.1 NUDIX hydrolase N-terminal domain-containing protein [Fusicatenibacter sp.]